MLFIYIRIENLTEHPHLYKQSRSRSVQSLKQKMKKLHCQYIFVPADKAAHNIMMV